MAMYRRSSTLRQSLEAILVPGTAYSLLTRRGMKIFEIFDKEKRAERKRMMKEELQRGYFDDFKELKDTKGKMFLANERLIPAHLAQPFPSLRVIRPEASDLEFPATGDSAPAASLVSIAFRAGAEDMLASWVEPFRESYADSPEAAVFDLSLVDSQIMCVWPFKQLILRAHRQRSRLEAQRAEQAERAHQAEPLSLPVEHLYHFGNSDVLRKGLEMKNRLTGYAFLVDREGLVRWRGSGLAARSEVTSLLSCAAQLLDGPPPSRHKSQNEQEGEGLTAGIEKMV